MFSHFLRKLAAVAGRSPPTVTVGGVAWHVTPAGEQLFGPGGPDPAAWETAGLADEVKRNLQRTITRVRLPGGAVYVKVCRANTPRSWAREVLRPPKARLEFENALAVRARGVAAVEPLAWGCSPGLLPGDSVLVTRALDGTEPLTDLLERLLAHPPPVRRQMARGLAAFVAKLHDAGVAHPDPHPGNLLAELPPSRVPHFTLMDLHAVRLGPPLSWAAATANLVLLNRWFQLRADRTDRLRFWREYVKRRALPSADAHRLAKEVESATAASNNRFWAARTSRHTANNRDSVRVRGEAASGYIVRDLPMDLVEQWLADPDAAFAGARILKDSRSSTVAEVAVGSRVVVYKRFNIKSALGAAKNVLRPSPALRSWVLGNGLCDRGLPTARPLAAFHRQRLGVPTTGYAVFEKVPDALGLAEAVAALEGLPDRGRVMRAWAERVGRLLRLMHERQVSHRDLKGANVLMAGAATDPASAVPVLIDLVGVEAGRAIQDTVRVRDLAPVECELPRLGTGFADGSAPRAAGVPVVGDAWPRGVENLVEPRGRGNPGKGGPERAGGSATGVTASIMKTPTPDGRYYLAATGLARSGRAGYGPATF